MVLCLSDSYQICLAVAGVGTESLRGLHFRQLPPRPIKIQMVGKYMSLSNGDIIAQVYALVH